MLKQLRSNTKLILVIVIIFFVGMIVFQWGYDITGQKTDVQSGVIGKVNGVKISYNEYDALVKNQRDMQNPGQRLTLDQTRMIHDQVWNYIVANILIEQEIEKREITYTDQELVEYMLNNPVSIANQISIFLEEDGSFSLQKYQDFLQNPANLNNPQAFEVINYIEIEAMQTLPRHKLQKSIEDAVIIAESELYERWLSENEERRIEWIFININDLRSYPDTVLPEEVRAYYEEHKDDYRNEELRSLETVFFPLAPTPEDSTDVLSRATLLAERARSGEDFSELADTHSEDPGNEGPGGNMHGGDLGYFGRGMMTEDFEDVVFNMDPGDVSDPFLTGFGYHVAKVDSVKYNDDSQEIDQVKARHILLEIEPSGDTQEKVEIQTRTFFESASAGMDFDLFARQESLQIMQTQLFTSDTQFIPSIGNNTLLLAKKTFRAKKGAVLPIYMTDTGYYVMRVSDVVSERITPFEEVESQITEVVKEQKRLEYAKNYCSKIYNQLQQGINLQDARQAVSDSLITTEIQTNTVNRDYYIAGIGSRNSLVARVFSLIEAGDTTGPVETDYGSGIAVLLEIIEADEINYTIVKEQLQEQLETERKNNLMSRFLENLQNNAEIVDNRDMFLPY